MVDDHEGFANKITSMNHWMHWVGIAILIFCSIGPPLMIYFLAGLRKMYQQHLHIIDSQGEINRRFQVLNDTYYTFIGFGQVVMSMVVVVLILNFGKWCSSPRSTTPVDEVDSTVVTVDSKVEECSSGDLALFWFMVVVVLIIGIGPTFLIYYGGGAGRILDKIHRHEFITPQDLEKFQFLNRVSYVSLGSQIAFVMWAVSYILLFGRGLIVYIFRGWCDSEKMNLLDGGDVAVEIIVVKQ